MNIIIAMAMLLSLTKPIAAQTTADWTRQKETQKKYLVQQIAALKVYVGYVSKGYAIAKNGLKAIYDFKHGDFDLHQSYFSSLATVNPAVKQYSRVAEIIYLQAYMFKQIASVSKHCKQSNQLSSSELTYLQNVFDNVLRDCSQSLAKLFDLTTDGNLTMTDDERIKQIDEIYKEMVDRNVFSQSFGNAASGVCVQRMHDQKEIELSKKLNDIK